MRKEKERSINSYYLFEEKGITLVALVITVIILLILAGVGISLVTGAEGLFGKVKDASDKYNNAAENEMLALNESMSEINDMLEPEPNGEFSAEKGLNTPDMIKLPKETTKYVKWIEEDTYVEKLLDKKFAGWYNYKDSKWANIKTTSVDGSLEAYWVWVPRFAYKLPENGRIAKTIEVAFVEGTTKTVVLEDGTKEQGYYATDSEITTGGTGLYINKIGNAHTKWIIHPAFTFGDKQLAGIWVAKYEASSTNPTETNGGGNLISLKVQVKPTVKSWRNITAANIFTVCRAIQNDGGALGTVTGNATVDTHMMKSMEWGAVAILSQSKYGNYNKATNTNVEIWNNPNSSYITGTAGSSKDLGSTVDANCFRYNTLNGTKASTTGNIYGVYDMAGGSWDTVAGVYNSAILGNPEAKYYDLYTNPGNVQTDYRGGKIGDLIAELSPTSSATWNGDRAEFINSTNVMMYRGGYPVLGAGQGIFAFDDGNGGAGTVHSFRPVLVIK